MEKIAAIVEGHTEEHFIRSTYGAVHVVRPIPNGKSVAVPIIVDAILDAIEVLGGGISKIVVLLDREERETSASGLCDAILQGLNAAGCSRKFYIGVSDRQFENWIVADELEMKNRFDQAFKYEGDGCYGKTILRNLNSGVSLGPRDTAGLLKACSALRASEKSLSLQSFLNLVDFDWPWAST
jgi:hypothetical protein